MTATATQKYWRKVREQEEALRVTHPSGVYLAFTDRDGEIFAGEVRYCPPAHAARPLVDGTHRIATAQEISAHHEHQAATCLRLEAIEFQRTQQRTVEVTMSVEQKEG